MGCAALENDEDTKDYIRKCSESLTETNYPAAAKACLSSGLGAWGEVLKALKDSPQAIAYGIADDLYKKNKPVLALNKFLKACLKDLNCKANLFRVGRGRPPTEQEKLDLASYENSWLPTMPKMEALWSLAVAKQNTIGNPVDPWMSAKMVEIFGPPAKGEIHPNLIERAKELIQSKQKKFQCLNAAGQAQMICYGIFSVLDPALAYSTAVKIPRLAKLIEATKVSVGTKVSEGVRKMKDAVESANKAPEIIQMKPDYAGETLGESRLGAAKVKYLTPEERASYLAKPVDGKIARQNGEAFSPWDPGKKVSDLAKKTRQGQSIDGALYVLTEDNQLMINPVAQVGKFPHSSFTAGSGVRGAGEMSFDSSGKIRSISNESGHYQPTEAQLNETIKRLKALGYSLREKQRYYPIGRPGIVVVEFY